MIGSQNFSEMHQSVYGCIQKSKIGILGNTIEEKTRAILGWTDTSGFVSPPDRKSSPSDGFGPDRSKKRKSSQNRPNQPYPYDLLNCASRIPATSRKSSSSSVGSLSSTTHDLSALLLSHELTPPPSPVFKNQPNGVTVVTMPRSLPQPPPYQNNQFPIQLPISPVSPPAPSALTTLVEEDSITKTANFRPGASATEIFERLRTQMPHLSTEQSKFRILVQTVANVIELETKLAQLHEETRSLSHILEEKRRMQQFQPAASSEPKWTDPSSPNLTNFGPLPTPLSTCIEDVPDDLQEIDVTAFRCLVSENTRDRFYDHAPWTAGQPFPGNSDFFYSDYGSGQSGAAPLNPLVVDTMS